MRSRAAALSLGAVVLAVALAAPAGAAPAGNQCALCHEIERLPISLGHSFEEWQASAHGRGGVGCEKCHGGDPAASDPTVAHRGVLPAAEPGSKVNAQQLAATCGACHAPELEAYSTTVHAQQVRESGQGATCFTCHGSMATSLPSPSELNARCSVCHKKPVEAQVALAVLASAKIRLRRTKRALDAARAPDPAWHEEALRRFHDLERSYGGITLRWHTFAMQAVLQDSRDLLALAKLLDEEAAVRARVRQHQ